MKRSFRIFSIIMVLAMLFAMLNVPAVAAEASTLSKPKVTIAAYKTPALKVSWEAVPSANKYYIYKAEGTEKTMKLVAKTSKLYFTDKDVKKDTLYSYRVRAYTIKKSKIVAKSDLSNTVKNAVVTLEVVKSVKAETISTSQIKLSWAKVTGADKYNLYYATKKDGTYKCIGYVTTTSYTFSKLTPGTTYYFKVKASKTIQKLTFNSKDSEVASAKTQSKPGEFIVEFEKISNKEAGLPTGSPMTCLSMMIKFYHGIDVDPNDLLKYFNCSTKFYKDSDGKLWGPDRGQYFVGNPKSTTLYGCGCDINIVQNAYKSFTDEHKLVNYTAIPFKEKFSVFNWQFDESKKFLEAGNILIVKFNTKKTLSDDYMFWMYYNSKNNAYGTVVDPNERYGILCGYTNNGYIIYNPLTDVYEKYDIKNMKYNLINSAHEFDKN